MKIMKKEIKIGNSIINSQSPTYFIADIASNHDGSLLKAKKLIQLAAEAGANAAKFQNFTAETLVSNSAFSKIGNIAHQSDWKESTFDGYNKVGIPFEWTEELKLECKKNKIDYFTSLYNLEFIDKLNPHVSAWKVGSGEISWHDSIKKITNSSSKIIKKNYRIAYSSKQKFSNLYEDIPRRHPNINKLKKLIKFKPAYNLDSIILDIVNYNATKF